MSGIKQPILDIMALISTLTDIKTVRIWNNQVKSIDSRQGYNFLFPAAFVAVQSPADYNQMGGGFAEADLTFTIYLFHEYYDASDGTFEQDLPVFAIRDELIKLLVGYQATACSSLFLVAETFSYDHDDVYEYQLQLKCSFIDSKGSPYDIGSTVFTPSIPPLTEITTASQGLTPFTPDTSTYKIPQS